MLVEYQAGPPCRGKTDWPSTGHDSVAAGTWRDSSKDGSSQRKHWIDTMMDLEDSPVL